MYQIPIRYVDTKNTKWLCKYLKYEIPNGYVHTKHRQIAAALPWSSLYRARQPERYCARVVHKVNSLLIFVFFLACCCHVNYYYFIFPIKVLNHPSWNQGFCIVSTPREDRLVRHLHRRSCLWHHWKPLQGAAGQDKMQRLGTKLSQLLADSRTTQSWKGRSWRFPTQQ